jgi:hypothetical protein
MYALFTFCRGKHSNILYFLFICFKLIFHYLGVIHPWGKLGPEEFTAFYISSCVVSSLVSIVFRRSMKSPGISLGAVSINPIL